MPRYHIIVKGRVQGVGFRYFVQSTGKQMKLSGWVKNLDNGNVELEVQGETDLLKQFMERLKKGNTFSKVQELQFDEKIEIFGETNFKVNY